MEGTQQHITYGSIMLILNLTGIGIDCLAIYLALKLPVFQNSYGYHVVSTLVSSLGTNLCFLFWATPTTILQYDSLNSAFSSVPGQIQQCCWFAGMFTHICTAVNRLAAIYWPRNYQIIFTPRNTLRIIAGCWTLSAIQSFIFRFDGCHFYWISAIYSWSYEDSTCGSYLAVYLDLDYNVFLSLIILVLNLTVIYKIRVLKTSYVSDAERRRRSSRDISFFIQSCVITGLIILVNLAFDTFANFSDNQVYKFIMTTVFWQLFLIMEGLVPFIFNREFRTISQWPCGRRQRNTNESTQPTATVKYVTSISTVIASP